MHNHLSNLGTLYTFISFVFVDATTCKRANVRDCTVCQKISSKLEIVIKLVLGYELQTKESGPGRSGCHPIP